MMTWFKRVVLFMLVNFLVMVTISLVLSLLGVGRYGGAGYGPLAVFCLVWGFAGSLVSLMLSRVMAKWSLGVKLVDDRDPLAATVRRLAERCGLPMPEVGVYDSPELNAFATGPSRNRALVAVSSGLLNSMDHDELEGVLGHELTHVANGDMVTMTLLQGVINAFVMFLSRVIAFAIVRGDREERRSNWGMERLIVFLLEMLLGFLGMLVVAAFSRWREYRADAGSARVAGREKMIAALEALRARYEPVESQPAYAAFKIAGGGGFFALLSTHPPLEDRIAALRKA